MRADEVIREGRRILVDHRDRYGHAGDETDQARDLLEHVLGHEPRDGEDVAPAQRRRFLRLVERRATGEPLAYIVGWIEYADLRMRVGRGAFVPRATSEFLATQAARRLRGRKSPVAVDLATGIGPVALAVARKLRRAEVHGADINPVAIRWARTNARELRLRNASFHTGDLFAPLPRRLRGRVDVVTMHPPYVPNGEVRDLPDEIRRFEPRTSLTDRSADGLGLVRRTVDESCEWLRPGGWLLFEVAPSSSNPIRAMLRDAGYTDVRSTTGELKHTRVITGRA